MKTHWINGEGQGEKVLFFHGWSMEPGTLAHLSHDGLSILVCFDYTDLTLPEEVAELAVSGARVVAWSLGVFAAARLLTGLPVRDALAINGTLEPVSAECGIAPDIFDGTIANWDDESARRAFYRRVSGKMPELLPMRSPEDQQQELIALRRMSCEVPANIYAKAVIGGRDRIFGAENQKRSWAKSGVPVQEYPAMVHDPFCRIAGWGEVLSWIKN